MLGNSDTYFYKIENKSIILSIPKLLEILEALDIKSDEFFYKDIEHYQRDREILKMTNSLDKDELEALILLLKRKR